MGPESPQDLSQAAMGSRSVFRQPSIDDMARLLTGLVGIAPESAMTTKRRDHLFAVNVRRLLAAGLAGHGNDDAVCFQHPLKVQSTILCFHGPSDGSILLADAALL